MAIIEHCDIAITNVGVSIIAPTGVTTAEQVFKCSIYYFPQLSRTA